MECSRWKCLFESESNPQNEWTHFTLFGIPNIQSVQRLLESEREIEDVWVIKWKEIVELRNEINKWHLNNYSNIFVRLKSQETMKVAKPEKKEWILIRFIAFHCQSNSESNINSSDRYGNTYTIYILFAILSEIFLGIV